MTELASVTWVSWADAPQRVKDACPTPPWLGEIVIRASTLECPEEILVVCFGVTNAMPQSFCIIPSPWTGPGGGE